MVYKRGKRPTWTFQARTATGYKQLGTRTTSKALAQKFEAMWNALASEHRAWDVLNRVLRGELAIGVLYDHWAATKYDLNAVRRLLQDVDVAAHAKDFMEVYRRGVKKDSADHVLAHLVHLLREDTLPRSQVTTEFLTQRLYDYAGKRNTLRKVHSSWSVFFQYLTDVKGLFEVNPMNKVERPATETSPIRFYELEDVVRIVHAQGEPRRMALFALLYGTGIEVSVALGLRRGDFALNQHEIRAAGTKAHSRDRVVRVADWAWKIVCDHVADLLPAAPLFPGWSRWTVSDWHRETVVDLGLPAYPLHNARDHWAVRALRAGTPVAVVQNQLGHGSPMLTLTKYGRFIPSAADRAKWEREATKTDRRSATSGAKMKPVKLSNSRGGT